MLSKVTKRRLTKLIEFMETLPKEAEQHFDMGDWVRHRGAGHDHGLQEGVEVKKCHLEACGTTACALGWAATMPYFRRAGLKLLYHPYFSDIEFKGVGVFADDTRRAGFLDLDREQSRALFSARVPVKTPKEWANRARGLVREWSKA